MSNSFTDYKDAGEFKEKTGYEIDGVWYPRVTSILSIKAKPALYRYYAKMPDFRTAEKATEQSALEGTAVHEAVEKIMRKEDFPIPSLIRPSVDAFLEFCRNNDIEPLKIEERIISKEHCYAGTIDMLAKVNGVVGVLDIKTSQAIYRDYGMQTAAYIQALTEVEPPESRPATSWVLRLDQAQNCQKCGAKLRMKGGNTKVRGGIYRCPHEWSEVQGEYEFQELPHFEENLKAFLAAKNLWEWEHKEYLARVI